MFLVLSFVAPASAFCGTFVATGDDAPTNRGSHVALVRQDGRTTLTMANDVGGTIGDFAMVIPVPEILAESAIRVVDPAIFEVLDGYSSARLVAYDCEDFEPETDADTDTDSDADWDTGGSGGDTTVEGRYIVGEYDVAVLSSTESGSLVSWLQSHGYNVPSESMSLLGEYIDGGSYFLAAQVRADAGVEDGDVLSPLQLTYADPGGVLPIRLGTLNSAGTQDLTIYGITPYGSGQLGIANYAEASVQRDCMLDDGEGLGEHVDALVDAALPTTGKAQWLTEYAAVNAHCDPCSGAVLSDVELESVGLAHSRSQGYDHEFTRMHIRYTPEQATQDLVIYPSNLTTFQQLRYIRYNHSLEDRFELCSTGWVSDPGTCDDGGDTHPDDGAPSGDGAEDTAAPLCGASDPLGAGGPGLILALAAVVRRRRR